MYYTGSLQTTTEGCGYSWFVCDPWARYDPTLYSSWVNLLVIGKLDHKVSVVTNHLVVATELRAEMVSVLELFSLCSLVRQTVMQSQAEEGSLGLHNSLVHETIYSQC